MMKRALGNIFLFLLTCSMVHAQYLFLLAGQSNANGQGSKKDNVHYNQDGLIAIREAIAPKIYELLL